MKLMVVAGSGNSGGYMWLPKINVLKNNLLLLQRENNEEKN